MMHLNHMTRADSESNNSESPSCSSFESREAFSHVTRKLRQHLNHFELRNLNHVTGRSWLNHSSDSGRIWITWFMLMSTFVIMSIIERIELNLLEQNLNEVHNRIWVMWLRQQNLNDLTLLWVWKNYNHVNQRRVSQISLYLNHTSHTGSESCDSG